MTKEKSEQMSRGTTGFRPSEKVLRLLEEAQRITGSDRSSLISACIEQGIEKVMEQEVQRRLKEAQEAVDRLKKKK